MGSGTACLVCFCSSTEQYDWITMSPDANITTVTDTCINTNSSSKPLTDDGIGDIVIQSYCSVDEFLQQFCR
jgi:hypothetical protein